MSVEREGLDAGQCQFDLIDRIDLIDKWVCSPVNMVNQGNWVICLRRFTSHQAIGNSSQIPGAGPR
jgi:hypothetical protein